LHAASRPFRIVRRWFKPGGAILTYHRIAPADSGPYGITTTPEHFAAHMEHLRRTCRPMSLTELAACTSSGTVPPRAVAVTFDDGYVDNLLHAKPVLDAWDIPATVFVATGYIGGEREFWWDELEQLLLGVRELPRRLELEVSGHLYGFAVADPAHREALLWELNTLLRGLPAEARNAALTAIRSWSQAVDRTREDRRPMTAEELLRLSSDGRVTLGAHSVSHPDLSCLPVAVQRAEIRESRRSLEALTGQLVAAHAHPFGFCNAETVAIVKEEGFELACAAAESSIEAGDDVFSLPRYIVRDWTSPTFRRVLEHHLVDRHPARTL